jgi:death-on-curing protein
VTTTPPPPRFVVESRDPVAGRRRRILFAIIGLASLAAAYGFGLARAHAFSDGNKRTAFVTMMTFLGLNAKDLSATELEVVEMMVSLAGGELTESALADWIRARLIRFTL